MGSGSRGSPGRPAVWGSRTQSTKPATRRERAPLTSPPRARRFSHALRGLADGTREASPRNREDGWTKDSVAVVVVQLGVARTFRRRGPADWRRPVASDWGCVCDKPVRGQGGPLARGPEGVRQDESRVGSGGSRQGRARG